MLSTYEIEFLLDLPNEYDLVLDSKSSSNNKSVSKCPSVQKLSNSSLGFSSQLNESLPAQKVKNKCELEEDDFFNSELYFKILKNSKNALKSVEEERNNNLSTSGNQSLLEKIKVYPVGGFSGGKVKEEDDKTFTSSTDKNFNIKRK
jgi:hypothetical protein